MISKKLQLATITFFFLALALTAYGFFREGPYINSSLPPQIYIRIFALVVFFTLFCAGLFWLAGRRAYCWLLGAILAVILATSEIAAFFAVTYFLLSSFLLGNLLTGSDQEDVSPGVFHSLIDILVGMAVWIFVIGILVHFKVNVFPLYLLLFSVPLFLNRKGAVLMGKRLMALFRPLDRPSPMTFSATAFLAGVLMLHYYYVPLPEKGFDSLHYHLMLPTHVYNHGYWAFDFTKYLWTGQPLGGDLTYTAAYILGGETAARLLNFSNLVILCGLLFSLCRTYSSSAFALLLTALFATSPFIFNLTTSLYVENLLAAFILGAAGTVLLGYAKFGPRELRTTAFLLAGSAATKIFGLVAVLIVGLLAVYFLWRRHSGGRFWGAMAVSAVIFLMLGMSSYVYSFAVSGNPIFPYYNTFFENDLYPKHVVTYYLGEGPLEWNLLYEMVFRTSEFFEIENGRFGFQYLALFSLILLVPLFRRNYLISCAAFIGVAFVAIILLRLQLIRHLYPGIPLLVIAGGGVLYLAIAEYKHIMRVTTVALVFIAAVNCWFALSSWFIRDYGFAAYPFYAANERKALDDSLVPPERVLIRYLNTVYGGRARISFVEHNPFGAGLEGVSFMMKDLRLGALFDAAETTGDLKKIVEEYRLTHLIASHFRQYFAKRPIVAEFLRTHARIEYSKRNRFLYRLIPGGAGDGRELAEFPPGRPLGFGSSGAGLEYVMFGFAKAEATFSWTDEERAGIELNLPIGSDLLLKFDALPFAPGELGPDQRFSLGVNGRTIAQWPLSKSGRRTYSARIPRAILAISKPAQIELRFTDRKSPQELGISGDTRRLGLALFNMSFEAVSVEASPGRK